MKILLHPKILALVTAEVKRCNELPKGRVMQIKDTNATDVVNEILWCALRSGDVTHHYKHNTAK